MASAFLIEPAAGVPGDVHSSALNPLYQVRRGVTAGGYQARYIYLKGVASTAIGSWVNIDVAHDGVTALLDTDVAATVVGRLAVATAAVGASSYGWYQIEGLASALSLTGATDLKNCFATSTAGSVDDANAGAETTIFGAFYMGAVNETSFLADVMLANPYMIGITLD